MSDPLADLPLTRLELEQRREGAERHEIRRARRLTRRPIPDDGAEIGPPDIEATVRGHLDGLVHAFRCHLENPDEFSPSQLRGLQALAADEEELERLVERHRDVLEHWHDGYRQLQPADDWPTIDAADLGIVLAEALRRSSAWE